MRCHINIFAFLAFALGTAGGCKSRSATSGEEPVKQSADAQPVELTAPRPLKIEGDFVVVPESQGKVHVNLKTNDNSFVSGSGNVDMAIDGDDEILNKVGLAPFKALRLENSGQDFKCQRERCAAFFRAVKTDVHGFDFLVSVQEGAMGTDPRMILSWPGSDGLFITEEADVKSIHWTYANGN